MEDLCVHSKLFPLKHILVTVIGGCRQGLRTRKDTIPSVFVAGTHVITHPHTRLDKPTLSYPSLMFTYIHTYSSDASICCFYCSPASGHLGKKSCFTVEDMAEPLGTLGRFMSNSVHPTTKINHIKIKIQF